MLQMGLPSNLKQLEIWGCEKLIANHRNWNLRRPSSLHNLWLGVCKELGVNSFPEEGLLPSELRIHSTHPRDRKRFETELGI